MTFPFRILMTFPFRILLPRILLACILLVAATGTAAGGQSFADVRAPAPGGFDRAAAARTTRSVLEDLIGLDTRNPPGNESVAAAYLDSLLGGLEGVETHVLEAQPGRGNFVAVLRAPRATKKPVLVMGHMDVVGADTTKWETPPLEPTERSGYLYGRGAIDDKGMLAATAAALLQLAPRRAELERDVIFLGTAGEEGGSDAGDVGVDWVLETHGDLIGDAEFALNEGGRVRVQDGRVRSVGIQTTEKVSYNVQMTARGTGGHGSVPLPGNALAALARAAARIHAWRAPVRLNETTRLYFAGLAKMEGDPSKRAAMERVATSRDSAEVARAAEVLASDPLHNAVLRSAGSLTMIDGGFRANVIPSEGTANLNLRVLPDDDPAALLEEIRRAGAEDSVSYRLSREPEKAPPASPASSDLYRAMERAAGMMAPGAVVMPFMSTGGTDGAVLRQNGIPTYGILPLPLPLEDELRMHGDNERVPLASLGWAAEYMYRVLEDVAGGAAEP